MEHPLQAACRKLISKEMLYPTNGLDPMNSKNSASAVGSGRPSCSIRLRSIPVKSVMCLGIAASILISLEKVAAGWSFSTKIAPNYRMVSLAG